MFRWLGAGTGDALAHAMRIAAVLAALTALPALAIARPITAGVSIGSHHDKVDSDGEGNRSLGLFGRVGLTSRLAGQLEVMKIETDDQTWTPTTVRTGTFSLRFDLVDATKSRFVPTVSLGAGIDRGDTEWDTTKGTHVEGGFGLEYRAAGGFNVGIDLRLGNRAVDREVAIAVDDTPPPSDQPRPLVYDPGGLRDGEYRALRVTAGIAF